MFRIIVLAVGVFASTNIDDAVVLAAFFANPNFRFRDVVLGQYLGIGMIVAVSALVGAVAVTLPEGYTALLGAVPLLLGFWKLIALFRHDEDKDRDDKHGIGSKMFEVAGVTIANGGDNLGVYVPLFAKNPRDIPVYLAVFTLMTAAWCFVGRAFVSHPLFERQARRYGRRILPVVMIAFGAWILAGARVLPG